MYHLVTIVVALTLGFLAGLLTFKQKIQWCPRCGAVKRCPETACRVSTTEIAPRAERRTRWNDPTVANPQVGRAGWLTRGQAARTGDRTAR